MAGFGGITQKNFAKPRKAATKKYANPQADLLTAPPAQPFSKYPNPQADVAAGQQRQAVGKQMSDQFERLKSSLNGGGGSGDEFGPGSGDKFGPGSGLPVGTFNTQPGQGDKYDGFASRYVPGERDLLFSNPGIIVQDWLAQGPYKNNPAMAGDLQRYADIVFGSGNQPGLYELLLGGNLGHNGANAKDDKQINYLAKLLGDQSTVGGRSPSIQQMVNMLYEMFDNPNSTLNTALGGNGHSTDAAGNPSTAGTQETINQVLSFIPLLGEFTGNQRFARLLGQQAQNIAQDYMRQTANGQAKGNFMDFFRQNFLT